jgi:regulation of enolase protein 1 (concanavalin A-like superfamily)
MRTRAVWLAVVLLIGLMGFSPIYAQDGVNLLANGGFEDGVIAPYGTYGDVTAEVVTECVDAAIPEGPVEGQYCLHLVVPAAGANSWDAGMTDGSHVFEAGKIYTFACFMKSKSGELEIRMKPERAADPYENYNEIVVTITEEWAEYYTTTDVIPADVSPASPTFHIAFAPGDFWIDGIRFFEGEYVAPDFLKVLSATDPRPADAATDVRRDTALNWEPGPYAATHNVYFGETYDDVNNADASDTTGILVSTGQGATMYDPPGLLEFGQTYYWRVDEVNAAPDSTIHKGNVWRFTVEPELYPIQGVVATASHPTASGSGGPEVTADGTGLTNGQHANGDTTMWSCVPAEGDEVWIQYDFDGLYKIYGMHIWNYNGLFEIYLGFGFKDVTIEYATEPGQWITLGDYELGRGSGSVTYAGQSIDVDGIAARSVRIVAHSNYGGMQYGISEVQFLEKPVIAREPVPTDGATDVSRSASLSWRPGREAASHYVQLNTDEQAVIDGTALADTVTESTYTPDNLLLGTEYFWRVDEVNEATAPSVWPSAVWSFTTQEYVSIDNFESYTDEEGERLFDIWVDGYNVTNNGSLVGHENPPYAEQTLRNSGRQSMPVYYDNTGGVANSVAELDLSPAQDWTAGGADNLSLYYHGVPTGFVTLADDNIIMNGTGSDIWGTTDEFRFVYKQLTGNGSIIARIEYLDYTNEWAKAGVMIRQTLDSDSVLVDGIISADGNVGMQWRSGRGVDMGAADDSNTSADGGATFPGWVKLTRNGNVFQVQYSTDGATWQDIVPGTAGKPQTTTVTMTDPVYIGLAVCSHATGVVAGSQLTGITTTGNVSGAWQSAAIGGDQPAGNGLDTLYIAVEDSAGGTARIPNPSPTAVAAGVWTQWLIPLSDLTAAGVNTRSITKFSLGVGDATQPSKNAAGVLYIDDIAFGHPIPAK